MKVVGLTGGIACGKSLCADELRRHFPLIDCDLIARDVVNKVRNVAALHRKVLDVTVRQSCMA